MNSSNLAEALYRNSLTAASEHLPEDNYLEPRIQISREKVAAQKIERSLAYMAQNLDKPLQVSAIAATINVSPSHFFALFKRVTGCPPIDYFIRLRMQRACELLNTTKASIKEIAAILGYNDQFYFSRIFKSVVRVAPTEYRAQQQQLKNWTENSGGGNQEILRFPSPSSRSFGSAQKTGITHHPLGAAN